MVDCSPVWDVSKIRMLLSTKGYYCVVNLYILEMQRELVDWPISSTKERISRTAELLIHPGTLTTHSDLAININ